MPDKKDFDDFWALERLLPKRPPATVRGTAGEVRLAEIVRPSAEASADGEARLSFQGLQKNDTEAYDAADIGSSIGNSNSISNSIGNSISNSNSNSNSNSIGNSIGNIDSITYIPESNPFLLSVTVTHDKNAYSFYAMFKRDAHRLYALDGAEAPYTAFFSYIPQYSQLSPAQKAYYLYFRTSVRERRLVKTDLSYFMLLVYEILNLPDLLPPEKGIQELVYLWCTYRHLFPQVDKYLAAWLPDYCLMHRLPCPTSALSPILPEVLRAADFKEFYLGNTQSLTPEGIDSLVALASDYRYRFSRYAVGENAALFEKTMHRVLLPVLEVLLREEKLGVLAAAKKKDHAAFSGSLCAHNMRCRLSVTYHPFSDTPRFRTVLTQAVKYIENKLRARLLIKSRLSVTGLPQEYKNIINRLFEQDEHRLPKKETQEPDYLRLYAAESTGISFSDAEGIEQASWDTTRRLLSEDGAGTPDEGTEANADPEADIAATDTAPVPKAVSAPPIPSAPKADFSSNSAAYIEASPFEKQEKYNLNFTNNTISELQASDFDRYGLGDIAYTYLYLLVTKGAPEARAYLRKKAATEALIAEEINGAFYVAFGDIVLEEADDSFSVIPDYEEELRDFISRGGMPTNFFD